MIIAWPRRRSPAPIALPPRKATKIMSLASMIESLHIQDDDATADVLVLALNSEMLIRATIAGAARVPPEALFDRAGVKRVAAMIGAHNAPAERRTSMPTAKQLEATVEAAVGEGT